MKVTIEHLTKRFPARDKSGKPFTAVNDFTMNFDDGKLVALLGPSVPQVVVNQQCLTCYQVFFL